MYPLEFFFDRTDEVLDDLALLIGRDRTTDAASVARKRALGAASNKQWPLDVKLDFIRQANRVASYYSTRLADSCYPNPPCP